MNCWIFSSNVSFLRSGTSTKKHFPEPLSMPPKTQWPGLHCPLWYLRWKNLLSSISTVMMLPSSWKPPISIGWFSKNWEYTSLQKLNQSITVFLFTPPASSIVLICGISLAQQYIITKILPRGRWLPEKNEPSRTLFLLLHDVQYYRNPSTPCSYLFKWKSFSQVSHRTLFLINLFFGEPFQNLNFVKRIRKIPKYVILSFYFINTINFIRINDTSFGRWSASHFYKS